MNVKPGDICLIVPGALNDSDAGKVVTAIERVSGEEVCRALSIDAVITDPRPIWRLDRPLKWGSDRGRRAYIPYCPEPLLLPLRDPDADVSETQDREVTA